MEEYYKAFLHLKKVVGEHMSHKTTLLKFWNGLIEMVNCRKKATKQEVEGPHEDSGTLRRKKKFEGKSWRLHQLHPKNR